MGGLDPKQSELEELRGHNEHLEAVLEEANVCIRSVLSDIKDGNLTEETIRLCKEYFGVKE